MDLSKLGGGIDEAGGEPVEIPCKPKIAVAADIVDIIGRYVSEDR